MTEVHEHPHPRRRTVAQHPPGVVSGLRLVPLIVLIVCVLVATVLGHVKGDGERGTTSHQRSSRATARHILPESCTPAPERRPERQPWRGPARAKSERVFQANMLGEQPSYVRGEKGWLFFNDWQINDFSQALGRIRLTHSQVNAWAAYLRRLGEAASAHGSRFYVVVAPAKWDVYPQYLPRWARKLRGTDSLDLLMKAHPELPFIDTRAALQQASVQHDTYEPLNSHWTPYGGYVAWKAITACLRRSAPGLFARAGVPDLLGVGKVPSSNEFDRVGIVAPSEPVSTVPEYAAPHIATTARSLASGQRLSLGPDDGVDTTWLPVQTRSTGAQTPLHLLALRDSTGNALSPLWSQTFATTTQYTHPVGCTPDTCATMPSYHVDALLARTRPDVTLLVMTERYLGYGPPA